MGAPDDGEPSNQTHRGERKRPISTPGKPIEWLQTLVFPMTFLQASVWVFWRFAITPVPCRPVAKHSEYLRRPVHSPPFFFSPRQAWPSRDWRLHFPLAPAEYFRGGKPTKERSVGHVNAPGFPLLHFPIEAEPARPEEICSSPRPHKRVLKNTHRLFVTKENHSPKAFLMAKTTECARCGVSGSRNG